MNLKLISTYNFLIINLGIFQNQAPDAQKMSKE
jgi:hypothetical protein